MLWTMDQPFTETWQHTTITRHRPALPTSEGSETHAFVCANAGISIKTRGVGITIISSIKGECDAIKDRDSMVFLVVCSVTARRIACNLETGRELDTQKHP